MKAGDRNRDRTRTKTMPYPLRLPQGLLELADLRAAEEHVDRSTALRQLLYAGAEEYILELLQRGRISLSKAAELLGCSTWVIYELAQERGITLGATAENYERAKERVREKLAKEGT